MVNKQCSKLKTIESNLQHTGELYIEIFALAAAICPVTKKRDFYLVHIRYKPKKTFLELESVKDFLDSFANMEISHEDFTGIILDKIREILNCKEISVDVIPLERLKVRVYGTVDSN